MTLYKAIRNVEHCTECLDSRREYLEQTAERFRGEIPSLGERAAVIARELRRVQDEVKQGKRVQSHRLSNYWTQEQIEELDTLVGVLGSDVWNGNGSSSPHYNDDPIRASKEGTLLRYKDNLFVNPGLIKKIKNGVIGTTIAYGSGTGVIALSGDNYFTQSPEFLLLNPLGLSFGLITAAVSAGFIIGHVKNPFERVADHLEQRSQYVLERLPELT